MKRVLIGIGVVVVVLVVAAVAASLLVDADRFRPQVQAMLGDALGREVTLGKLHVALWSGSLDADDIRIADAPGFGTEPFVSAKSLAVGVDLWSLLVHRTLHVTSLTLDRPVVRLRQTPAGRWNFASPGAAAIAAAPLPAGAAAPPPPSVDRLRITDGSLVLERGNAPARTYDDVRVDADHLGTKQAFPFSMSAAIAGGGTLKLDGTLGPWNAKDAVATPLDAHLVITHLDLVAAGLVGSGDGVGGVLDFDTRIHGTHGIVQSKGEVSASALQLVAAGSPATRPLDIAYQADYRLDQGTGDIHDTMLGIGAANVAVDGHFDSRSGAMQLALHLHGSGLPIDDLQAALPAFGLVLPQDSRLSGGTLGVDLRTSGPLDALVIRGPVTLDDTRLAGFSLGANLGTVLSLAGIHAPSDTVIHHAEAVVALTPAGVQADPFSAELTGLGEVRGKGGMAADGRLDISMLVKPDETMAGGPSGGVGALLGQSKAGRALGGMLGGTTDQGIGVHVGGTAGKPSFKVDPAAVAGLLESGLAASRKSGGQEAGAKKKPARAEDVLGSLLRGALKPKKKKDDGAGH
jgi:AsmA protein